MKLLLADDHTLFREALAQFIERAEPDAHVFLAKDLHEAIEILDYESTLDLVLLDLRMPGMDGLAGLKKIRSLYPETKIVLLSGIAEKQHVNQAMSMGAKGFFPKTLSGKAMLGGVHKILSGEDYIALDHNNNEIMPSYYSDSKKTLDVEKNGEASLHADLSSLDNIPDIKSKLTPREKEVLVYLMRGASNKEIAREMDLQVVTVKLHVRGVCRKLKAKNRTQAALIAQQLSIVS